MGFWSKIWKTKSEDWVFSRLGAHQVPDGLEHAAVGADSAYLSIFLRSMRIVNVRKGLSKFYGVVHSYISVPYEVSTNPAEFQVVVTPSDLKDQDAKNLDRVINLNQRLLGPIPYRGGDVDIEVGLFSVKSADLAGPFVEVLQTMSTTAGVSVISAALPFVQPIKQGINLLAGGADDTILEIGLSTMYNPPQTGYFFVMRARKGEVNPGELRVGDDFRLSDASGQSIQDFPYMVLAVETSERREDWFQIPEISSLYKALQDEVRKGDVKASDEAFATFRRAALTSPDLLGRDARQLVVKVEEKITEVLRGALTSSSTAELPDLGSIGLYT